MVDDPLREPFQARRDIDGLPEDVAALDDDVSDVDADAELDASLRRHCPIAYRHPALDVDGATDGIDHGRELDQHPVPSGLDDPSAMFIDLRVDERAAMRLWLRERAFLVLAHEPAVAGNIGRQNGRKPPLDAVS